MKNEDAKSSFEALRRAHVFTVRQLRHEHADLVEAADSLLTLNLPGRVSR